MILNVSKIKTEALLLFCRDLINSYKDVAQHESINKAIDDILKGINHCVQSQEYYIFHRQNIRIKSILKSYNYINETISKILKEGDSFNPAMLVISMLAIWFEELEYEKNSKEFIFFLLYPYGHIYDTLIVKNDNKENKKLSIAMTFLAEELMQKLHNYKIN